MDKEELLHELRHVRMRREEELLQELRKGRKGKTEQQEGRQSSRLEAADCGGETIGQLHVGSSTRATSTRRENPEAEEDATSS